MRIAQLVTSYYPLIGGVETHVRHLARGCAQAGDDVTILTHETRGSAPQEWRDDVRILRFPLTVRSRTYPFSMSLLTYIRAHSADFDLVHAHSYHTLAGHLAGRSSLPFVFTPHYHGTGHTAFRSILHKLYRPIGERQFRAADLVVCVSDAERALVAAHFGVTAGKTVTIPNGVKRRANVAVARPGVSHHPVALTIGRLERYKNVDLIIDAFSQLPRPATLIVVGDGPDRGRLEHQASRARPGWPVVFTGQVSEEILQSLLAHADVVTSASDHEAFGLALADAMAAGARVVASAIPAHAELGRLAGTNAPCSLVDPRNIAAFTQALADALDAGRSAAAVSLPSWTDVVAATREVYSRVSADTCPPSPPLDAAPVITSGHSGKSAPAESV